MQSTQRMVHRVIARVLAVSLSLQGFFVWAPRTAEAVISNGANAINVLGQTTGATACSTYSPSYTRGGVDNAPNAFGLSGASDIVVDTTNHRLFVADSNNHRVLVYNLNGTDQLVDRVADNVLGQPDLYSATSARTQSGMYYPKSLAFDATNNRLFVGDRSNYRILVFNVASITNGENAVNVLGQANFTAGDYVTTQSGMKTPWGLAYDSANSLLFAADSANNRVLVFNVASITDGENAINVLGQSNFTSSGTALTQAGMNLADGSGIAYDSANTRLFVSDSGWHRVKVYNTATITDGEGAVNVLGQTTFTAGAAATTGVGLRTPVGLVYNAATSRLFVADQVNHRVKVYNVLAITDGESGANYIGQANSTTATNAVTQAGMSFPEGVGYDPTNNILFVSNASSRVTTYDMAVITTGESAVDVMGQSTAATACSTLTQIYTQNFANNGVNPIGHNAPSGAEIDTVNHRLFVADTGNNRVLVYNLDSSNQLVDRVPDNVLGQADLYTNTAALSQTGLSGPYGLAYDSTNNRLFVGDSGNARVLVYDTASISDGEAATFVLGQADFTTKSAVASQTRLASAYGLSYDSTNSRLFVSDGVNNRVIAYDVASVSNGEAAVGVLGQTSYTGTTCTYTTQSGMCNPTGVAYSSTGNRLFVVMVTRVLVFDVAVVTGGENAVNVLGQTNFTAALDGPTQSRFYFAIGVEYDAPNDRLFVSQSEGRSVFTFDVASITNGEAAINVLGASAFTGGNGLATQSSLNYPNGMAFDSTNERLYVTEMNNNRVVAHDVALFATNADLSVTKTVDNSTPTMGGAVAFTVTVSNAGDASATSVVVKDLLPAGLTYASNTPSQGSYVSGTGMWTVGTITSGGSANIVINATVNAGTGGTTITNWAEVWSVTETDPDSTPGNSSTTEDDDASAALTVQASDLSLTKSVDVPAPGEGDTIAYTVTVSNSGPHSATSVVVKDLLPVGVSYISNTPSQGSYVSGTGMWTVGTIANGGSANIVINATVDGGTAGSTITNVAEVQVTDKADPDSTPGNDSTTEDDDASAAITVLASDLSLTKTVDTPTPNPGDTIEYTITVSNGGPSTATSVIVEDVLPAGVTYVSDSPSQGTYDDGTGMWTVGTVSNGGNATLVITVTVDAGTAGSDILNASQVYSVDQMDPDSTPGDDSTTEDDDAVADLHVPSTSPTLSNAVAPSRLGAGASATYDISFALQTTLSGTLTVTFPAGFTVTAAATDGASSDCLSSFGFSAQTLTATKTNCSGAIVLGGATVTNPSTPGAYTITWVNDDPGESTIYIIDNDHVTVTGNVDPFLTFNVGSQAAATACDGTFSGNGGTLALGVLSTSSVTSSDASSIDHLCTRLSTNASLGAVVTVRNANGSSGLVSSSVPSDTIPSSTATLSAGTAGYGLCAGSAGGDSGNDAIDGSSSPIRSAPYNATCTNAAHNVGGLTASAQSLWSLASPSQNAFVRIYLKASISGTTAAHADYSDTLIFVGTGTF